MTQINYITGPAGCGKTRRLAHIAAEAGSRLLPVFVIDANATASAIQSQLSQLPERAVVLVDEGLALGGRSHKWGHFVYPAGAQVFVAGEGPLNVWVGLQ